MKIRYALRSFIIIGLLLFISSCQRQEPQNSIEKSSKRIKSILESIHDPVEYSEGIEYRPESSEDSFIIESTFDPDGHKIRQDKFDDRGNLEWRELWTYDIKGNNVEHTVYHFKAVSLKQKKVYSPSGELQEGLSYDANSKLIGKLTISFDSLGRKVEQEYSLERGTLLKISEKIFNEKEQQIETMSYSGQQVTYRGMNQYDNQGNCIETIQHYPRKKRERIFHYKYDSLHNLIETIVLNNSQMIESKIKTNYDHYLNPVECFTYEINGNLKEYVNHVYEYDEAGYWTKDIRFVNKKPKTVTIRKIEYYK